MATLHAYLTSKLGIMEDPTDSVIYGPSNTNKIERWWHKLHGQLEAYLKAQLSSLLKNMEYDQHNNLHRQVLAYIYILVVQREVDKCVFRKFRAHILLTVLYPATFYSLKPYLFFFNFRKIRK